MSNNNTDYNSVANSTSNVIDSISSYAEKTGLDTLMSFSLICTFLYMLLFAFVLWVNIDNYMKIIAMFFITFSFFTIVKLNRDVYVAKLKINSRRKKQN